MNSDKNQCIECTVENCKYHLDSSDCCTRSGIEVGSCNCHAENCDNTFCRSFESKSNSSV